MKMTSEIGRREFLQHSALASAALWLPQLKQDSPQGEYEIALGTWPHRIYKEASSAESMGRFWFGKSS